MLRAGVRALAALAPPLADRLAPDLFFRPHRRHEALDVAALACHRWQVRTRAGWLTAWDYGAGPTVLMIHGWSGVAAQWARFTGPLVQAGYNAVAIDLPAHGASEGTRTNLRQYVEAILDTADRIKPIQAVLGHSLGATAVILALARGLRAERAVLIAPASRDVPGYVHAFAQRLGLPERRERHLVAAMQRRFGDLALFDARRAAAGLRTPVMMFHDIGDREVPFAEGSSCRGSGPAPVCARWKGSGTTARLPTQRSFARPWPSSATPARRPLALRRERARRATPARKTGWLVNPRRFIASPSSTHLAIRAYIDSEEPTPWRGKEVVMLILVAGLLLALFPFLVFIAPIVIWAAWPSIAFLAAVYVVRAIQRRRHTPSLVHQS